MHPSCYAHTTLRGFRVDCEKPTGHDGDHVKYEPGDIADELLRWTSTQAERFDFLVDDTGFFRIDNGMRSTNNGKTTERFELRTRLCGARCNDSRCDREPHPGTHWHRAEKSGVESTWKSDVPPAAFPALTRTAPVDAQCQHRISVDGRIIRCARIHALGEEGTRHKAPPNEGLTWQPPRAILAPGLSECPSILALSNESGEWICCKEPRGHGGPHLGAESDYRRHVWVDKDAMMHGAPRLTFNYAVNPEWKQEMIVPRDDLFQVNADFKKMVIEFDSVGFGSAQLVGEGAVKVDIGPTMSEQRFRNQLLSGFAANRKPARGQPMLYLCGSPEYKDGEMIPCETKSGEKRIIEIIREPRPPTNEDYIPLHLIENMDGIAVAERVAKLINTHMVSLRVTTKDNAVCFDADDINEIRKDK